MNDNDEADHMAANTLNEINSLKAEIDKWQVAYGKLNQSANDEAEKLIEEIRQLSILKAFFDPLREATLGSIKRAVSRLELEHLNFDVELALDYRMEAMIVRVKMDLQPQPKETE